MAELQKILSFLRSNLLSIITVTFLVVIFFVFIGIPIQNQGILYSNVQEIYFADDITISHQKAIDRFNEINEGRIRVVPVNLPFTKFTTNQRKQLLARNFRSKSDKIDVFAVDLIWVPRFSRWAEPLGAYFSQDKIKSIHTNVIESCYYNNELVALPLKIDIGTMYYRKDLLEKLPGFAEIEQKLKKSISWEDFLQFQQELGTIKNPYYLFPADNYEGLVCSFVEAILNLDRDFFKKEGKLNSEIPRKALRMLKDLVHRYKATPEDVTGYNELMSCEHYVRHDGLFIRYWPEFFADYENYYKDTSKSPEFVRVPLPHFEGYKNASILGGWNLMVSRFSDNKEAALEFVRFMLSEEAQQIMMDNGDTLPVLSSFYKNTEKYIKKDILEFYDTLFQSGVHRPYSEDYTRRSDIIAYYVNKTIKNEISPSRALAKMDEMIETNQVIIQ